MMLTSWPSSAIHPMLAILWIGVMLSVLVVVFAATGRRPPKNVTWFGAKTLNKTLKWLSTMGLLVLTAVFVTGLKAAYPLINKNYAGVFVTDCGWLLLGKLAIICLLLAIALWIHFIMLPALATSTDTNTATQRTLRTLVVIEGVCTLALMWAGHAVANDHPPNHAVVHNWPYPFRFSIANTWGMGMLDAEIGVWAATVLLIMAGGIAVLAQMKGWRLSRGLGLPTILTISAIGVGSYALAVEAFPETYRPTPVPFKAKSIAHAMTIFAENCVLCHGYQAKGDGILSKTLPKKPVDLLTEPHASMHTPGDFFHWLTNGIPRAGMPAWGEKFSEEDRWDLVNLVHALSRGYQARIINPRVLPGQPYLVPPGFSYTTHDGSPGRLKDFRGKQAVLLVLFSWPESRERLDQLRLAYSALHDHNAEVLAVPVSGLTPHQTAVITKDLPFPLVSQNAVKIARTYSLFRRTISHPDLIGQGTAPKHMEFLFDRFGYLRARWIPEIDVAPGWNDIDFMTQQVNQLNREKEILPPPTDYVQEATHDLHHMGGMDMGGMKM